MEYCKINHPPAYTEQVEHWTRETDADGDAMGAVIEQLVNNDHYLKERADRAEHQTPVFLPASGWGSVAPYTQTVAAAGITAADIPGQGVVYPAGCTREQQMAINKAVGYIYDLETGDGTVTLRCTKKPGVDVTLGLKGVI